MNTNNLSCTCSMLLVGLLCLAPIVVAADLNPQERETGLHYLAQSRQGVQNAVQGLSDAQWKFKPAPDRWSVAEVVEHMALIEAAVENILLKIDAAPAGTPERDVKQIDAMILLKVPDRSQKVQAPPQALPTGRWSPQDALNHFQTSCTQIADILESKSDLRAHIVDHPVLGPLDGYQWILAVAAHNERHTKQILEVKADPHFPTR
jgi:DinB superfamily